MALFNFNRIQDDEYLVKWKDWPAWTCSWEAKLTCLMSEMMKFRVQIVAYALDNK